MADNSDNIRDESKDLSDDEKLLEEAKSRFQSAEQAYSENRIDALDDLEFASGKQWDDAIKSDRTRDGRPCLVINKIPQFIQQITNDQRQNRPAIKVHPIDDDADVETAKIIQGLVRHIEYDSNADVAYDTAFEGAATCGFGAFRVITEYENPKSFNQSIKIKAIPNQFSVLIDPNSKEPDGSDANWAFVTEDLSHDEYKTLYPKSEASSSEGFAQLGKESGSWKSDNSVRVTEYFYKEIEEKEICLLSDGRSVLKDEAEEIVLTAHASGEDISVVKERTAKVPVIKWCKLNGIEVLEKTDWLGSYIPIVPVYGQILNINGKRILKGVVRDAKDPARMYNYWKSAETEAIALAPRAPYILAEGQVEGHERAWATANRFNHPYLSYKPTSVNGIPLAPPQRQSFEPAIGAITQASMGAAEDIKATTGIYDASLGGRSNETSGVAIQRRNSQSQTSNFHFVDNLTRSLRQVGRILIDLMPHIYDTARTARIIAEDGEQKVVKINEYFDEDGKPVIYALDAGKYDVTVDVGPSFATKRQEASQNLLELSRSMPTLSQAAPDLIVKSMDFHGAQELAERLKKTLPPNLIDDGKDKSKELPPQVQQQMQSMSQMVEQLTEKLHALQDEKEMKLVELESRERIEMAKLENSATIELAKLQSKEALNMLAHQISELDQRTQMLGMNQPFNHEQEQQDFQQQTQPNPMDQQAPEVEQSPIGGDSPSQPLEGYSNE